MEHVGSIVSLSCGDILGTYQGKVIKVDNASQTITIDQPFRNGKQCSVPMVTINAADIHDLKILISSETALSLPEVRHQPLSVTVATSTSPTTSAPINTAPANCQSSNGTSLLKNGSGKPQKGIMCSASGSPQKPSQSALKPEKTGKSRHSPHVTKSPPRSPIKYLNDNGGINVNGDINGYGHHSNGVKGQRLGFDNGRGHQRSSPHRLDETNHGARPRKNSFTDNQMVTTSKRGYTTPRKAECRKKPQREDAFSEPVDTFITEEFDFEKNLAMFDKMAVFEQIESLGYPKIVRNNNSHHEAKYKNDENILPCKPVLYDQISLPGGAGSSGRQYVTDTGLVVPCVSYDLRTKLLEVANTAGYSIERQVETVGRSAAEMVLQLIGGNHRLVPQNAHQQPSVVVLCGPHVQGAQGVNCARHLAAHNVRVTLFMPNFVKVLRELQHELQLFDLCDGTRTASVKDLPSLPVDIIVNAMDNHDNKCLREQSWYQKVVLWTNQNRAPVLGVDPPVEGGAIDLKWSLSIALPLALSERCGQVYLCDLSLPNTLYQTVGITYACPFAHKFVIPLHQS